jgi:putative PIN family toxin of toxin-antitoxin system
MKVVVDSNVLLAAAISEGPPFEIVNMVFGGRIAIVFSRETFGELADVLMTRTPFDRISREVRAAYVGHLAERGIWARPVPQSVKCRDPQDQAFLDLAVSSGSDYLITGDEDLLVIKEVGPTKIRTPRQFLEDLRGR